MRDSLRLVPLALAAIPACTAPSEPHPATDAGVAAARESTLDRGRTLFGRHCAVCHGAHGDGDTAVAALLSPRPLPFKAGNFLLVSTANGVPSDDDLVGMLHHGMPGSTMMAWDWLPEPDLRALAHEVRRLAVLGTSAELQRSTSMAPFAATAIAERELEAGPAAVRDLPPPVSDAAAGERLFLRHCAACHGTDGRGTPGTARWPGTSEWWPRDLTRGFLRGGSSREALATRITAGMPGVRMPPTPLNTAELGALVDFVAARVGDANLHRQRRATVQVERVASLPAHDDEPGLAALPELRLAATALRWRPDTCTELRVRTAHDGRDLVLRVEWDDTSRDDHPRPGSPIGDGVAVQFTAEPDPPALAMGSAEHPLAMWRWHAYDPHATAGMTDALSALPHQHLDVAPATSPAPRSERLVVRGLTTVAGEVGNGRHLAATAGWREARWSVTFRRALRSRGEGDVALAPGTALFVAFAVWDGRPDARPGTKAITTWHRLELAP